MDKFYIIPDITAYKGLKVQKDTILDFTAEGVEQKLENLKLVTKLTDKTEKYESSSELIINLDEGDILIFDDKKGYILPGIPMATAKEIAEDFESLN